MIAHYFVWLHHPLAASAPEMGVHFVSGPFLLSVFYATMWFCIYILMGHSFLELAGNTAPVRWGERLLILLELTP